MATVQLRPTTISKWNTALQLALLGTYLAVPVLQSSSIPSNVSNEHSLATILEWTPAVLHGLEWLVGVTTLWSAVSYALLWKRTVRVLTTTTGGVSDAPKQRSAR